MKNGKQGGVWSLGKVCFNEQFGGVLSPSCNLSML